MNCVINSLFNPNPSKTIQLDPICSGRPFDSSNWLKRVSKTQIFWMVEMTQIFDEGFSWHLMSSSNIKLWLRLPTITLSQSKSFIWLIQLSFFEVSTWTTLNTALFWTITAKIGRNNGKSGVIWVQLDPKKLGSCFRYAPVLLKWAAFEKLRSKWADFEI